MIRELEYPFDANYILSKKKHIKKQLLADESVLFVEKKIAILGGYTTSDIKQVLELFLLNYGIIPRFYESEYNQFYQDGVFSNDILDDFCPDVVYICTSNRNVINYPLLSDSAETIAEKLNTEYSRFEAVWQGVSTRFHCPIIQNNFEMPLYRLMGNKDASDIHGKVNFLSRLNMLFYDYAADNKGVYICDINYISADYGLSKWQDSFYYHMYKYAVNVNAIPYLSFNVANIIKSIFGKNKKGMVLDLDNTLWGGVVGDDGVDHIQIGPEESEGQLYMEFQKYIKEHKDLGVVLNVASKNDIENAVGGLNHPDGVLKPDDFACIKANWFPKDENFLAISNELDLLPESLVFIDDNPAERFRVIEKIENVSAPNLGEPQNYINILDRSGFFETTTYSEDDGKRSTMYQANVKRKSLEKSYEDYGQYLLSLKMRGEIKPFEPIYIERITQLTNKSNQFNLTTKRYTISEIEEISYSKNYIGIYGKLEDRFGDNGLVSVVIGNIKEHECHVELWIMSCRVLKRDMEFAMMDSLVKMCRIRGINRIFGYYYPTKKNSMVKDFYTIMGFDIISRDNEGNTQYVLNVDERYINKNSVIDLNLKEKGEMI